MVRAKLCFSSPVRDIISKIFGQSNLAASSSSASFLVLLDFTPLVGFVGLGLWEIKLTEFVMDFYLMLQLICQHLETTFSSSLFVGDDMCK